MNKQTDNRQSAMRYLQQKDHFCMIKSNFDRRYESKDLRERFRRRLSSREIHLSNARCSFIKMRSSYTVSLIILHFFIKHVLWSFDISRLVDFWCSLWVSFFLLLCATSVIYLRCIISRPFSFFFHFRLSSQSLSVVSLFSVSSLDRLSLKECRRCRLFN